MVRSIEINGGSFSPIPLAMGMFVSVTLLVALCAKHARQNAEKKSSSETSEPNTPKSPLKSPKQLITTCISHKGLLPLVLAKKARREYSGAGQEESGLWQKAIMMGEKCQPPEFSGVIYYDYSGNRISEMPKSPARASPFRSLTFPAPEKIDKTLY